MPDHPAMSDPPPHQPEPSGAEHPPLGHEESDIRFAPILGILVVLGVVLALVAASAGRLLLWREQRSGQAAAQAEPTKFPAQPRLEPLEPQRAGATSSFATEEAKRRQRLQTFGPTDDAGFVHIPIDVAMRHLANELSSADAPEPNPKSQGLLHGGESNSGRLYQESLP